MTFNFNGSPLAEHAFYYYPDSGVAGTTANSGAVAIASYPAGPTDQLNVSFSGLSPLYTYNGSGPCIVNANSDLLANYLVVDDALLLSDGVSQVTDPLGQNFEPVTFGGWSSLQVIGNTGNNNVITMNNVDGAPYAAGNNVALSAVTLQGGAGNDTITVNKVPTVTPPMTTTLLGGDGTNGFYIDTQSVGAVLPAYVGRTTCRRSAAR